MQHLLPGKFWSVDFVVRSIPVHGPFGDATVDGLQGHLVTKIVSIVVDAVRLSRGTILGVARRHVDDGSNII